LFAAIEKSYRGERQDSMRKEKKEEKHRSENVDSWRVSKTGKSRSMSRPKVGKGQVMEVPSTYGTKVVQRVEGMQLNVEKFGFMASGRDRRWSM